MTRQWPNYGTRRWQEDGRWYIQLDSRLPCGCLFGGKANHPYRAVAEQRALADLRNNADVADAQCIARRTHRRRQR